MLINELLAETGIGDLLRAAAISAGKGQTTDKNQNANARPMSSVSSITPKSPQQYSTVAGTSTPQNGIQPLPTTTQSAGAQDDQQGQQTQQDPSKTGQLPSAKTSGIDPNKIQPSMLQTLFKPGQTINLGAGGQAKVKSITPQGVNIDATKVPSIDSNITIAPKDLFKP
jgi:hypothetical protein